MPRTVSHARLLGVTALLLIAASLALPARAQSTGKIAGTVTDAASGEPLIGVNVVLDGTTQGAITDLDGDYDIFGVRPGTYAVLFRYVGFQEVRVEGVQVNPGQTTDLDVALSEEVIEGEEVIVTAERPVVQRDRTTTTAFVSSDQIESLPVTNLSEVISLQAGIVDGHFRGGRIGEVAYLVNGVPITNAFDGGAGFELEQNMVENLEIVSGVFNAEYGQALSGVVNATTRDVPTSWEASAQAQVGALASGRTLEFVERTSPAGAGLLASDFETRRYSYWDAAPLPNQTDALLSLGGPLVPGLLGFRASGRYLQDDGTLLARRVFMPSDASQGLGSGDPGLYLLESTGDQAFVAQGGGERWTVNGALVWKPRSGLRLDYNAFVQVGEGTPYNHFRKYVPEATNTNHFFNQTHILSARQTLSDRAFVSAAYSLLVDRFESYLFSSISDGLSGAYVPVEQNALSGTNAFAVAGNDLFRVDNRTRTHTLKADLEWQIDDANLAKTGVQLRLHDVDNRGEGIEVSERTGFEPALSENPLDNNDLTVRPWELGVYVQDKLELDDLIINAGVRLDVFDPAYDVPVDFAQASLAEIPNIPGSSYYDSGLPDSALVSNRTPAGLAWQVSPRLGLAFPISATGVLRFSAGLFFQTPSFDLLYTNPEYEAIDGSDAFYGNPALDPERTLTFEAGLQQALTDRLGVEVTVFSKDIRNLVGQEVQRSVRGGLITRWINADVGTIRGITFSAFQRRSGPLAWTVDYTLQFAEGTASDPGETFARFQAGQEEITSLVRLDWDRRHVLTNTLTLAPLPGMDLTFINQLQTGTPYTTIRNDVTSFLRNDDAKPTFLMTDLRLFYRPPFFPRGLQLLGQVENLFDELPQQVVYSETGLATESLVQERFERSGTSVGGVNSLDDFFFNPTFVGAPRRVSLGLRWQL